MEIIFFFYSRVERISALWTMTHTHDYRMEKITHMCDGKMEKILTLLQTHCKLKHSIKLLYLLSVCAEIHSNACSFVRSFISEVACLICIVTDLNVLPFYTFKSVVFIWKFDTRFIFFLFIRSLPFSSHFNAIICIINIYILWYVHTIRKHLQYIRSHTYAFIVALKPLKPLKFKLKARTRCIHTWSMVKVAIFLFMVHMRAISSRYGKYMMSLLCRF